MSPDVWGPEEYDAEAQRLYEEGEYEAALELLAEGVRVHPGAPELRVSLGYCHLALESYAWARRAFGEALELEEEHEEALVGLGDALLKLGERGRAFAAFHRVLELGYGDDSGLMLAVARSFYREELYERALRFYERARDRAEGEAELGYTFYQLGRPEEARGCLERALGKDPDLHEARVFLGNLIYDDGDYAGALSHFRDVPPREMWDPLAVWRTVELLRGLEELPSGAPQLRPYLSQLDRLSEDPAPEERLLAEVEASGDGAARPTDLDQLDLFVRRTAEPEGREPTVRALRIRDGRVFRGDWISIVRALRDDVANPSVSVAEFMRNAARLVQGLTGVEVPHDDPEGFLRASARAGLFRIEE